jgi:hypothetical protein
MTVRQYEPGLDPTQAWERSAEANPPSRGRQRLIDRQQQIRSGDGNEANAAHGVSRDFPPRETPGIV